MSESSEPIASASVLIVDDIAANRNVLGETLEKENYEVLLAPDGEAGLKVARKAKPDLILLDVMMPGIDGFETCRRLKADEATRAIPVVFISAQNETRAMVDGFRAGGVDYITKPFQAEEVLVRVSTHLTNNRLTREVLGKNRELEAINEQLRAEIARREVAESSLEVADAHLGLISRQEIERWGLEAFVGESPAMRDLIGEIRKLQPVDNTSVLIRGESGTGKELVARALHFSGRRCDEAFIVVNCAAVPAELAESIFFGHVKGAFSGATENKRGYFEMAHRGTLFLDEIGDMPMTLQAKLLRVLEDGSYLPVGSSNGRTADVRVLSATNVDLKSAVDEGRFRKDLYFRLAGYEIELKPLRERQNDVALFVSHFLQRFSAEIRRPVPELNAEAREALLGYHYPGNVRELKSIVERAVIESGGRAIEAHHLHLLNEKTLTTGIGSDQSNGGVTEQLPWNLEAAELELVKRALKEEGGNVSKAADRLGIHRSKVYRIMAQD